MKAEKQINTSTTKTTINGVVVMVEDESIYEQEQYQPQPGGVPGYFGPGQNPEFLRYLLDSSDPIAELQNELEGKEIIIDRDQPILAQTRIPLVNPALRNKLMGYLKTYNTKGFKTTRFKQKEIQLMLFDVASSTIDLLEICNIYKSDKWKEEGSYNNNYPAFLEGSHQQILLLIEHTVQAALNSSEEGMTLNKVTGMHTSIEQKHNDDGKQRRGWKIPILK